VQHTVLHGLADGQWKTLEFNGICCEPTLHKTWSFQVTSVDKTIIF
jgi:hypothetical protein